MLQTGMLLAGRYEILQQIGSGGMAYVYRAIDYKLNRHVAIKVLKEEFCKDKSFVAKFRMEAQSAAGLSHANIVGVYDVGENGAIHYIVMELIEGITLKEYITRKRKLAIKESIGVAIQVAQGLEAAHSRHLVHRDIKPQNIIISRDGKIKVTDFGIARAITDETTNMYKAAGSVHYMSPEQARGGYCDEKSDIYSLGITMYEMVTGRVPFDGDTTVAVAIAHMNEAIIPPSQFEPSVPLALEQIIFKCVQKKPERRYASCAELIIDLRQAIVTPQDGFVKFAPADNSMDTGLAEEEIDEFRSQSEQTATHDTIQITPLPSRGPVRPVKPAEPEVYDDDDEYDEEIDFSNPASKVKVMTPVKTPQKQVYTNETAGRSTSQQQVKRTPPKNNYPPVSSYGSTGSGSSSSGHGGSSSHGSSRIGGRRDPKDEPATLFDKILVWFGSIFGIAILVMVAYIGITMYGVLTPKKIPQPQHASTEAVENTEEEVITQQAPSEGETMSDKATKVPSVLGLSVAEAEARLSEAELGYVLSQKYSYSDDYPIGTICAQKYPEGAVLKKGSKITLTLSLGSNKLSFDGSKYLYEDFNVLKYTLNSYPEIIVEAIETESETTKKGTILKLEPEAGLLAPGDTLKVYYSKGPTKVAMTSLLNMTEAQARAELERLGLYLTAIDQQYSNTIEAGLVCAQSIPITQVVAINSGVAIAISAGKVKTEVPYVIGVDEATAISMLNGKNLAYNPIYESNEYNPKGTVIAQDVGSGSWVDEWTTVTITISTGPAGLYVDPEAVTGMTQDEAIQFVLSQGLNYTIEWETNQWVDPGFATRLILPNWGVGLKLGDTVVIRMCSEKTAPPDPGVPTDPAATAPAQ